MPVSTAHGVAAWSSQAWREQALSWLDEQLAGAGIERTGDVEQPSLRPWATVLKVPTARGPVWMKAAGPGTAFEAALYELLARAAPERVLTPIATDVARGWMLLPDGGPSVGDRLDGDALIDAMAAAMVEYGRLQRDLFPHVDDMLAIGVADMRPQAMPGRFEEALACVAAVTADERGGALLREVEAMRETFAGWCERLAGSPIPPSLDHNDLHHHNVLLDMRFYDWGDSVVAHPFAAMLVPLGMLQSRLGARLDDPRLLLARDAYLDVFADLGSREELAATLELACHVAKAARALTWERALSAAREQGEEVAGEWASAPAEMLAMLLDESYLGRV
jgi:hypothetical protein